jgi:hypothetical protein
MKKPIFLLFFISLVTTQLSFAQEATAPGKEYAITLSTHAISLAPGESKQVQVLINRSKTFLKGQVELGLSSSLPEGVTISFEPAKGQFDSSVATITASAQATAGQYPIIVRSRLKNLNKGSILSITVDGNAVPKNAVTAN